MDTTPFDPPQCASRASRKLLGELWNILPYKGLWETLDTCDYVPEITTPPVRSTDLVGLPYDGNNTGQNPNLRLIEFRMSNTDGPITTVGVPGIQPVFFSSLLIYKIRWHVEPINKSTRNVSVGFYTPAYLSETTGDNIMLPMLTTKGPAFYASTVPCKTREFTTTGFNSFYVVVDANVVVRMRVSYQRPCIDDLRAPCFRVMFKPYKYIVGCDDEHDIVAATQRLVDDQSIPVTSLQPTPEFRELAQAMINYLTARQITVTLLDTPATPITAMNVMQPPVERLLYDLQSLDLRRISARTTVPNTTNVLMVDGTRGDAGNGLSFALPQVAYKNIRITFNMTFIASLAVPGSNNTTGQLQIEMGTFSTFVYNTLDTFDSTTRFFDYNAGSTLLLNAPISLNLPRLTLGNVTVSIFDKTNYELLIQSTIIITNFKLYVTNA